MGQFGFQQEAGCCSLQQDVRSRPERSLENRLFVCIGVLERKKAVRSVCTKSSAAMSLRASTSRAVSFARTNRRYAQPSYAAPPGCCSCSCKIPMTRRFQTTSAAPNQDIEEHDIVIVGGGLVGLALANALCMPACPSYPDLRSLRSDDCSYSRSHSCE